MTKRGKLTEDVGNGQNNEKQVGLKLESQEIRVI